jgi:hypothetical protein
VTDAVAGPVCNRGLDATGIETVSAPEG